MSSDTCLDRGGHLWLFRSTLLEGMCAWQFVSRLVRARTILEEIFNSWDLQVEWHNLSHTRKQGPPASIFGGKLARREKVHEEKSTTSCLECRLLWTRQVLFPRVVICNCVLALSFAYLGPFCEFRVWQIGRVLQEEFNLPKRNGMLRANPGQLNQKG